MNSERMNPEDLHHLKQWFHDYCGSFTSSDPAEQRNFSVKEFHTHEVCTNIVRIGRELSLEESDLLLAEAIALFHDVGRFLQYHTYRTFDDSISVNHAALSAQILIEKETLAALNREERDMVLRAVTLHNVFELPKNLDERTLLFVKLIRDADKLDILRVVREYFLDDGSGRADAVALGLPDAPGYSPVVLKSVQQGTMARKADLTTQNDFKLLMLSWLYDLNFTASHRIVIERRDIDHIASILPEDDSISRALATVRAYVASRVRT
jgi:hypothetical protein